MIITISRQFGSGGRELGKRLADALGLEYYDREIITEIAKSSSLDESYVNKVLEKGGFANFSFSFAHTIPLTANTPNTVTDVLVAQQKVIQSIAKKGDCVIVGRSADVFAAPYHPVKLFVYADRASKIKRCRERAEEGESFTDKQLIKSFKTIDKGRAKLHDLFSSIPWGEKDGYDLMINTSNMDIKKIVPRLADLVTDLSYSQ
ncbi:MAG: cytidylate kinase-like family protein [Clostridia bacterium]|nr:cytidylate kinase-like family protein [Clostridia bacterium]